MMSNTGLLELSRRLRTKSAVVLDVDLDFAFDLMAASCLLDDLYETRVAVDALVAEAAE
jgi:hypothetical protein